MRVTGQACRPDWDQLPCVVLDPACMQCTLAPGLTVHAAKLMLASPAICTVSPRAGLNWPCTFHTAQEAGMGHAVHVVIHQTGPANWIQHSPIWGSTQSWSSKAQHSVHAIDRPYATCRTVSTRFSLHAACRAGVSPVIHGLDPARRPFVE